jgi:outer membrane protein assembly factor BamD (BamD/ComL family)
VKIAALPATEAALATEATEATEPAAETAIVPLSTPSSRSRTRVHVAAPAESPAELFARANAARRAGHTREAARSYQQLQREFPGSSEELVSRVTLGRWMLDRLHDPAGALARFDSYLANPVHTALREEALIGRALALGRLGRRTEERGAWTAFLAAFPGSVYVERAHGRLEALR